MLMLPQMCFKPKFSLPDVDADALLFIDDICFLLHKEGSFTIVRRENRGWVLDFNTKVVTSPPFSLLNGGYIREVDSGQPLLPFPIIISGQRTIPSAGMTLGYCRSLAKPCR